ncbi:winged helix-turn-helix domain-containing protein [Nereida sp. NH-UV-3]|uniref:winged helix-turn-helix domain-containing protein n=1 Tax=Nereida TaxID=282198 RepID=UPI0036F44294
MTTPLRISNTTARDLWLAQNGLADAPTGPLDVMGIVARLGFVQLDTIQVVARAHHHIVWSRNQNYREHMLDDALAQGGQLFEHFTHDASLLPIETLPIWQRQFRRKKAQWDRAGWARNLPDAVVRAQIKERIAREGPLSTHAFDTKVTGQKQMWARPPHKLALDYMWYAGELATSHRVNFTKYYDLAERIFPAALRDVEIGDEEQLDMLCHKALGHLGFGTSGDIQRFWEAATGAEVAQWVKRNAAMLCPVEVQSASGAWLPAWAPADIEERLMALGKPTSRLRILNPFDPAIRERARLARLFGFEYRVEMFVPAAKRVWGYYVFPLLEGRNFVGRIEVKADRKSGVLNVLNFWPERRAWPQSRFAKLDAELDRMRRFVGLDRVVWQSERR